MKNLKLALFALAINLGGLLHAAPGNSPDTRAAFNE
jgi:hypothetical protein